MVVGWGGLGGASMHGVALWVRVQLLQKFDGQLTEPSVLCGTVLWC